MSSDKGGIHPIDIAGLYRVEMFTDALNGDIKVLVPVTTLGADDGERKPRFYSSCVIAINGMPNNVNFEIAADTLQEACERFGSEAEAASQRFIDKMEEQRRAPRIIQPVPGRVQ